MRDYNQCFAGGKPSAVFLAATAALEKLPDPVYAAGYVLAKRRDEKLKVEGYTDTPGSIRRLIGKNRIGPTDNPNVMPDEPPANDHGALFLKNGKPIFYMSRPYGLSHDELRQIIAFADRWGLTVSIDGLQSNWFPSLTVCVRYEVKK